MSARIALALLLFALPAVAFAADPPELEPGKKLEGELTVESKVKFVGGVGTSSWAGYLTEQTVSLKAGGKIAITATVLGKGRGVAVWLKDPTGKVIDGPYNFDLATSKLQVPEVGATGKYTVVLISDQIGAYTVKADYVKPAETSPKAESPTVTGLQEKVARLEKDYARLEKEVAEVKAKLKELQEKK
jgi:hypothetical protein